MSGRVVLPLLGALLFLRLAVAASTGLSPDEAYYWVWSRALAPGYLDHPPMVALMIRAGTALAGENPLGVRLLGPVASFAGSLALVPAARDLLGLSLGRAWVSSGGYVLLHWGSGVALVGASGAISGLMGATSRLLDRRSALAPFASRTVIAMAGAWVFINLLMAMGWIDVGAGGAPIAWEAHLIGYAAGLLLIGPASRGLERA